jgi:hypothetical protein
MKTFEHTSNLKNLQASKLFRNCVKNEHEIVKTGVLKMFQAQGSENIRNKTYQSGTEQSTTGTI